MAPTHSQPSSRKRWVASCSRFTSGKGRAPIIQEPGWASGLVWMGTENLSSTRIRSLDHLACSESPYQPRCPGWFMSVTSHSYLVHFMTNCEHEFKYTVFWVTLWGYNGTLLVEVKIAIESSGMWNCGFFAKAIGRSLFWNIGTCLSNYTVFHPARW
jgi:hypothetical protein